MKIFSIIPQAVAQSISEKLSSFNFYFLQIWSTKVLRVITLVSNLFECRIWFFKLVDSSKWYFFKASNIQATAFRFLFNSTIIVQLSFNQSPLFLFPPSQFTSKSVFPNKSNIYTNKSKYHSYSPCLFPII